MYNKDINNLAENYYDENEDPYFELTIQDVQSILSVSKNTARKYKNELVNKNLILEIPSKGQKAARYMINKDLELKNEESTYIDENGKTRFSFIEVPHFLFHPYFSGLKIEDVFVYSVLRNCMNKPIEISKEGKRTFVTRYGRIFCLLSDEYIQSSLRLNKKKIKNTKNRLCEAKLLREEISNSDKNGYIRHIVSEPMTLPKEDIEERDEFL